MQRMKQSEPGQPKFRNSDRRFRLADGRVNEANKMFEQQIAAGLLAGNLSTCI